MERNGAGHFDINNVVAADEWAENVDNNASPTRPPKRISGLQQKPPGCWHRPNPDWELVAANIPILKMPDGTTREHQTYAGEGIKQADVNLFAYPLKEITDPAQIRKDLEFIQPVYPTKAPQP